MLLGFLFVVLQNVGYMKIPEYFKKILDEITTQNRSEFIERYIVSIFLYTLFTGVMMYGMRYLIIGVSRKIEYLLRKRLFAKLMEMDAYFFLQYQTGDVISRCTNDLNDVRTLLGPGLLYIPNSVTRFLMFLPILFSLNQKLMIFVTGLMVILVILIVVLLPLLRPFFQQIQEQIGKINNFVWESATGITTIKLYNCEKQETENFAKLNQEYIRKQMRLVKWRGFLWPFFIFIFSVAELFILYIGGTSVIEKKMTIGELLQFNVMIGYLTFPILALGWIMSLLQQGLSALKRIDEILSYSIPEKKKSVPSPEQIKHIKVKNLNYMYPNALQPTLKEINLEIDLTQKSFIGITGEIGGGKSTLIHVLTNLLPVPEKNIFVDDIDIFEVKENTVFPLFSLVQQQPFLFSRTIKENIIMARKDEVDEQEISKVISLAGLDTDVERFPDKLNQTIGERGITLSGGQRQRLAIARALYKKSPILILDDALSSVDAKTEEQVLEHIRNLNRFKVIIFISHRISALKKADVIYVMKNGKFIEQGTHTELIEMNGYYAKLARLQQLTMEENLWN